MLRFFNALISSGRGRSGAARMFLAGFARIWLVAAVASHLALTSSVHETPPAEIQPDFIETQVLYEVLPNVTFDYPADGDLDAADGDLDAAAANLKAADAISKAAEAISDGCSAAIASYSAKCAEIGSVPLDKCMFESVIRPWALAEGEFTTATMAQTFPQYVSPAKKVRDAAVEATRLRDKFLIEVSMREDLYRVTLALSERPAVEPTMPTEEERRFLEKKLLGFKQNGLDLDDEKRGILKKKRGQIANLCTDFSKTLSEDTTELLFSAEELDGATERFLNSLSRDEATGKYRVTMSRPDMMGVLQNVHSEAVREKMAITRNRRCEPNTHRLADAVKLRHECAELLGYPDHATFRVENNMAKKPSRILHFLQDLQAKLTPFAIAELAKLTELKAEKTGVSLDQVQFHSWDYSYYTRLLTERDYELNGELVREYFSLEIVTSKILSIFEEVLGLRFSEITDAHARKLVWHKDVTLWEVRDAEGCIQPDMMSSDAFVGHLYLDLFPRDGKTGGAICWDLQPGFQLLDGTRQFPIAAIVTNFTKPTDTEPSLLRHAEVVTLFHELGHAMHGLCSRAQLSRFHGVNVERDFLEIPSQLFEYWCWDEEMLTRLSQHYVRENESLPPHLLAALVKTKSLNAGLINLYLVSRSLFDLAIHGGDEYQTADAISKLFEQLERAVSLIPQPENVWPAATFDHMMDDVYDAGFYGYLWSKAISTDIFYSHFANTLATPAEAGRRYRDTILRPGGTQDGMDMLFELLGREPKSEPFLRSLGLIE